MYSTEEAAKLAGVHRVTLLHWLASGKVRTSQNIAMSGKTYRRWTDADMNRLRRYKEKNYYKGRGGSKPKAKR